MDGRAIGIIAATWEFEDVRSLEAWPLYQEPLCTILAVPTTAGTAAGVASTMSSPMRRKTQICMRRSLMICHRGH